jgi:1-pyrroline-5-carboxylate dehydrogenase
MKVKPFRNEPLLDFSKPANIKKQEEALKKVRKQLGKTYEIVIGGKKIKTENTFNSINPSKKDEVVATFYKGTADLVNKAVETAFKKFEDWKDVPAEDRAKVLI